MDRIRRTLVATLVLAAGACGNASEPTGRPKGAVTSTTPETVGESAQDSRRSVDRAIEVATFGLDAVSDEIERGGGEGDGLVEAYGTASASLREAVRILEERPAGVPVPLLENAVRALSNGAEMYEFAARCTMNLEPPDRCKNTEAAREAGFGISTALLELQPYGSRSREEVVSMLLERD